MSRTGPDQIASELGAAAATPGSTLFCGAGVGVHAGLPDWRGFVSLLATAARPYDGDTADIMGKRITTGQYLNALELYRICPLMPEGTRLQQLGAPFVSGYNAKALRPLVALPFDSIVTTNFDRSLHDAYAMARGQTAFAAELGDPSLNQAIYHWKDAYIARIHGRAEVPSTLVVDQTGYQRTEADSNYTEFLVHILTRTRCVFIGYSFIDPAIFRVLQVADSRVSSAFPIEHLAILPASGEDLRTRLARYNIRVLLYDDSQSHEVLWNSVREALTLQKIGAPKGRPDFPAPLAAAHRFLAASYARAAVASTAVPLRSLTLEGITIGLLSDHGRLTRMELAERVRAVIPLTSEEAETVIQPAVDRLVKDETLGEDGRQLVLKNPPANRLGPDLDQLAKSVTDRMKVRMGLESDDKQRAVIREVLESLVLSRGWDLAASLASAKRSDLFELEAPLSAAFRRASGRVLPDRQKAASAAIRHLLERPDREESRILTRLARLSFGVEVALERGRTVLVHSLTLPERLYLDASVLLPAIATGHPYRASYTAAIRRLQDAAARAGLASRVLVLEPFVNEIVSHRANAIEIVRIGGLEDTQRLARLINFTRAEYTNVYVGGYSALVGRAQRPVSFSQYLAKTAPYQTEAEASAYLRRQGIETVSARPSDPKERGYVSRVSTELASAYAADSLAAPKPDVLIRHEAQQLARLMRELESGARSVFVTADSRLRRLAKGELLGRLASALFSHTGLLQLVDMLVGLDADDESLARLLWAVEAHDERDALRGYFTDLALRKYDAALAMSTPKLLDGIVEEALGAAPGEGVPLAFVDSGEDVKKTLSFLDRFEDRFYESLAEEMRKKRTE